MCVCVCACVCACVFVCIYLYTYVCVLWREKNVATSDFVLLPTLGFRD